MNIFLTSDTHFGHANIIKYCARPFHSVEEMDREMIRRWNSVVGPRDIIYHLGDFAMAKRPQVTNYVNKLNGIKYLIRGNHDRATHVMYEAGFDLVFDRREVVVTPEHSGLESDILVCMTHHPVKEVYHDHAYHFCGHIHEMWKRQGNLINVGVDQWDFTPRTFRDILTSFIDQKRL